MSGHLQRLVRSVMQPVETVHPLVGSVFSAPEGRKVPDKPSWNPACAEPSELPGTQHPEEEAQSVKWRPVPLIAQNEFVSHSGPVPNLSSLFEAPSLQSPSNATQQQALRTPEHSQ